jgi:hypothetical protein
VSQLPICGPNAIELPNPCFSLSIVPGSGMKRPIVKDRLAGRPVSSRVDLDRRGHAGQDTDVIRYLIDRMRAGTRASNTQLPVGVSDIAFRDPNCGLSPIAKVDGFRASAINLRIVPCRPLDGRRLPTFN